MRHHPRTAYEAYAQAIEHLRLGWIEPGEHLPLYPDTPVIAADWETAKAISETWPVAAEELQKRVTRLPFPELTCVINCKGCFGVYVMKEDDSGNLVTMWSIRYAPRDGWWVYPAGLRFYIAEGQWQTGCPRGISRAVFDTLSNEQV